MLLSLTLLRMILNSKHGAKKKKAKSQRHRNKKNKTQKEKNLVFQKNW